MPYASESDLDRAWGQTQIDLITIDETIGGRDTRKIAAALEDASALVDSYCSRRYALPLTLSEAGLRLVSGVVCDLAAERLAATIPGRMTELIAKRAERAMAWLRDIAAARADLSVAGDAGAPGLSVAPLITPNDSVLVSEPRTFTRESLRAY